MADIAMCGDHACPSSDTCYRYQAVTLYPSVTGCYLWEDFYEERAGRDKCDSYWPVDKDPA
jgi:hypothetical protein